MGQNVLIIGGGGREHALAWKLAQSSRVDKIFVAPGNGGTRQIAKNVAIDIDNIDGLLRFAEKKKIDLTIVGSENSLALGIVDAFQARGLRIFGPTARAAEIESSKAFAKELMREAGIPTAAFCTFNQFQYRNELPAYIYKHGAPIVIKASELAFGKGVHVCETMAEIEIALQEIMLDWIHKDPGREKNYRVVVEDFLGGQEISIHAFCDGKTSVLFPTSQDHKPVYDGDKGKNTGGMGTIAPVPWVTTETLRQVDETIVRPVLKALVECGRTFTGLLYPGLKMTNEGPKVLEFNARFGDPETQSYMRLLKSDLLDVLEACVNGTLAECAIEWYPGFVACVVLASGGYPDTCKWGVPIYGVAEAERVPGVVVFHAGTIFIDGELKTSGGRVLGVTAVGETLRDALDRAYEAARLIQFEGMHYRRDIGAKALVARF